MHAEAMERRHHKKRKRDYLGAFSKGGRRHLQDGPLLQTGNEEQWQEARMENLPRV